MRIAGGASGAQIRSCHSCWAIGTTARLVHDAPAAVASSLVRFRIPAIVHCSCCVYRAAVPLTTCVIQHPLMCFAGRRCCDARHSVWRHAPRATRHHQGARSAPRERAARLIASASSAGHSVAALVLRVTPCKCAARRSRGATGGPFVHGWRVIHRGGRGRLLDGQPGTGKAARRLSNACIFAHTRTRCRLRSRSRVQHSVGASAITTFPSIYRWLAQFYVEPAAAGAADAEGAPPRIAVPPLAPLRLLDTAAPTAAVAGAAKLKKAGGKGDKAGTPSPAPAAAVGTGAEAAPAAAAAPEAEAPAARPAKVKAPKAAAPAAAAPPAPAAVEDPITACDFRVGLIVKAWVHPSADRLYCEVRRLTATRPTTPTLLRRGVQSSTRLAQHNALPRPERDPCRRST